MRCHWGFAYRHTQHALTHRAAVRPAALYNCTVVMSLWLLISVDSSLFGPFTNGLYVLGRYLCMYVCLIISPAFVIQDGTEVTWYSVFKMLPLVWSELCATPFLFRRYIKSKCQISPLTRRSVVAPCCSYYSLKLPVHSTRSLHAVTPSCCFMWEDMFRASVSLASFALLFLVRTS